jgi:hypothetical protein
MSDMSLKIEQNRQVDGGEGKTKNENREQTDNRKL